MGSCATSVGRPTGRTALAGTGAAGSLLAAVVAAALIAPGAIDFDDWSIVPPRGSGGSLSVADGSSPAPLLRGPGGSATAARVALPGAPADRAGARERGRPVDRRGPGIEDVRRRDSGVAGSQSSGPGGAASEPRPHDDPPAGLKESLARTTEGVGAGAGGGFERLGATSGSALGPVHPWLGRSAGRAGAASADRFRRTGKTVGEVVRRLPDGGPASAPLRRGIR